MSKKLVLVSPDGGEYAPASKREETRLLARGYTVKKDKPAPAPAPAPAAASKSAGSDKK